MTRPAVRNLAASVKARLAARATAIEDVQHLLMRYALERLLYRLSQSRHAGGFTLKGALVFLVWNREPHRSTKDLDLATGRSPSTEEFAALFRELLDMPAPVLLMYARETVVAEKFEIVVQLGIANSRMKDLRDSPLSRQFLR